MSDQKIHLAIVRSECKVVRDRNHDLDQILTRKLGKYPNFTFEVVAWDLPNDWDKYTHILLGSGIDYVQHPEKWLSWLEGLSPSASKRVLNSPSLIQWNMDKKYLLELKEAGIPIPPILFLNKKSQLNGQEIINKLKSQTTQTITDLVLKNQIDAGGLSTDKIKLEKPDVISEKELLKIQEMMDKTEYGLIIQNFLPAIQTEGEWAIIYFDRKLSHCALKKPKENDFRVQSRHGGGSVNIEIEKVPKTVLELSKKVVDFVPKDQHFFYARVDIIRDGEEALLMELEAFEPDLYMKEDHITENFLNAICSPRYKF